MTGKFIVVDGPDGCGKTTLLSTIRDHIGSKYHCAISEEYEPTRDSDAGRLARDIINGKYPFLKHLAMEELIRVDRIEHSEKMRRQLESGVVLCSRYYFSTMVYQTMDKLGLLPVDTSEESLGRLWEFNDEMGNIARRMSADPILVPDLYIVLNADPLILDKRIKNRGEEIVERYETIEKLKTLSKLFSLYQYYVPLGSKMPRCVVMVDAGKEKEEVWEEVKPEIDRLFEEKHSCIFDSIMIGVGTQKLNCRGEGSDNLCYAKKWYRCKFGEKGGYTSNKCIHSVYEVIDIDRTILVCMSLDAHRDRGIVEENWEF